MDRYHEPPVMPRAFLWRRLQSFMGLFLVIFLIEHLLTNSQASLLIGDDGIGFINAVNGIHNLPYLPVIEITLLGVPFFIHIVWGIKYLMTSKQNAYGNDPTHPTLGKYAKNHAYTWQRITSWILVFFVIGHVVQMRFMNYPTSAKKGTETFYMIPVSLDDGIYTVSERLGVSLVSKNQIKEERKKLDSPQLKAGPPTESITGFFSRITEAFTSSSDDGLQKKEVQELLAEQELRQQKDWVKALTAWTLNPGEVIAIAPDFGTAELMLVRDTFKSPLMLFLYSIFVLAATYHAFNGLWTFNITWGITLTARSQSYMRIFSVFLMFVIGFLGLVAIWGSYLVNLNH
ncbi:MAG: succinate dehydrogenase [Chlamydiota bacterium]